MHSAIVTPGGPKYPDRDKIKTHEIDEALFYDTREVDLQFFNELRAADLPTPGIQIDPSWFASISPSALAELGHSELKRLGAPRAERLPVLFDIELHDAPYIVSWHRRWKQLRAGRETYWTLEPFQGGWFTPELVDIVNNDSHLELVVQFFLGKPRMYPVCAAEALKDLEYVGIKRHKVLGVYDGEKPLPWKWNGIVLGFDQLPKEV